MKKSGLGDSPFFTPYTPQSSGDEVRENSIPQKNERNSERTVFRSEMRTMALPIKRRTKRYSFEFYEDQLTRLKKLKYQADITGETLSLSDMVRQALDLYLQDKDV